MSFFSKLLGQTKVIDDVFDKDSGLLTKVGSWIGNSKFTDEEIAELNAKTAEDVRSFVIETLEESTDRSKARREIATGFIKFYMLMLFMSGMTYLLDPEWSKVWFGLATSLSVGGLVTSISIFFFGSHALARHTKTKG